MVWAHEALIIYDQLKFLHNCNTVPCDRGIGRPKKTCLKMYSAWSWHMYIICTMLNNSKESYGELASVVANVTNEKLSAP